MANEYNHKIWGVADFKRYHNGTMPDLERHALEKASLEDPFLQDALDGYVYAEQPEQDLVDIREKLWPVEKRRKAPVVWYKRNNLDVLWKAAAIFLFVGGVGWLIYSNAVKDGQKDSTEYAALEKTAQSNVETESAAPVDSTTETLPNRLQVENRSDQTAPAPSPGNTISPSTSQAAPEDDAIARIEYDRFDTTGLAGLSPVVNNPLASRAPGAKVRSASSEAAASQQLKDANLITGRVVDAAGQPVPYANVTLQNSRLQQGVAADANGNFAFRNNNAANEKVTVQANAVGYETTNVSVANNSVNNNIVLNESKAELSEVVVTKPKNTKKARQAASSSSSVSKWHAGNTKITLKNATPINGWDHFFNFMNDSTALRNYSASKKGAVTISFLVDSLGKPKELKLLRSLEDSSDNLSEKILKNAPALRLQKPGKRAEARIVFD